MKPAGLRLARVVMSAAMLIGSLSATLAATIYGYTGNRFTGFQIASPPAGSYDSSMFVSGSFTVASPLAGGLILQDISAALLDFSFNDRRNTLTPLNVPVISRFEISTNLDGSISGWAIDLITQGDVNALHLGEQSLFIQTNSGFSDTGLIVECTAVAGGACTGHAQDEGHVSGNPGLWTQSEIAGAVPLPAALPLFATGLAAVGLLARRRRTQAAHAGSERGGAFWSGPPRPYFGGA